jgi:PAS domain S-box-containing protein
MTHASFAVLAQAFALGRDPTHLMAYLHHALVARTGGLASLVLEREAETGTWIRSSGSGTAAEEAHLAGPDGAELDRVAASGDAVHFDDLGRVAPGLARAVGAPAALAVRVPLDAVSTVLLLGLPRTATPDAAAVIEAAHAFAVALEWTRLARAHDLQRQVRELVLAVSRSAAAPPSAQLDFDALCAGLAAAFEARRASLWMLDRRARVVRLEGSSEPALRASAVEAAADDPASRIARAVRLDRPQVDRGEDGALSPFDLLVPLRGRRRALGAVVIEGLTGSPATRAVLVDGAHDLARQLSSVIDNVQLLGEVLRSRRELEDIFDSLADLVVVCDPERRITFVNRAFAERAGRRPETLRGEPLARWVGPETDAWVAAQAAAPLAGPTVPTRQLEDPVLQGTFVVTVTGLTGQDTRPLGSVVVLRDITEQARLEAERAALRQQLAQSEKLAALGQFVAGIAHELNNPLQGVLGHLELLRTTGRFTPAERRALGRVYREADRAAKIVGSLLVFAGKGQRVRRRCRVNQIVERALAVRAARLRKAGIEVVRELDPHEPRIVGDPLLLQQAFFNIILNAEQAMSGKPGRLEVSTRLARRGEWVVVRIRDTGPGLSEQALDRLFEPFFTTKEVGKGTGLGLAITYGIIQDHSGQIRAGNHPKGGAVFTIELPTEKLTAK